MRRMRNCSSDWGRNRVQVQCSKTSGINPTYLADFVYDLRRTGRCSGGSTTWSLQSDVVIECLPSLSELELQLPSSLMMVGMHMMVVVVVVVD
uniref:IP18539p n=1 Tax=Drosophila melanogaster TaxID=7227 RepID=A2VEW5_DROME|nr:IP18539p [Drosophila melanogaster]